MTCNNSRLSSNLLHVPGLTVLLRSYLREHAKKARKEEKAFARTLWAEARANEDRCARQLIEWLV